jgi:uncharacterized protein YdeI (YjbR/CyaY-like superfamily)
LTKNAPNPAVDFYFTKAKQWRVEMEALRHILLDSPLTEELKWGVAAYTHGGKNVALIHAFKDYCAVLFVKGSLLKDPKGLLIQQTENVQAARQMRFTGVKEITAAKAALKTFLAEAIKIEEAGQKVPLKPVTAYAAPEEWTSRIAKDSAIKKAFSALTPGRQKAYLLHFAGAKQAVTREARIEKCRAGILAGKGLGE